MAAEIGQPQVVRGATQVFFHARQGLVGVLVVAEDTRARVERNVFAEPIRDVRQMAQGARIVAFLDVGVQILAPATANGRDEIGEVIASTRTATNFTLRTRQRLGLVSAARIEAMSRDEALFEMEDVADPLAAE